MPVDFPEELYNQGMYGVAMHCTDGYRISIHPSLTGEDLALVVLEEVLHLGLDQLGQEEAAKSEPLVKAISTIVHSLMKNNPEVLKLYG